MHFANTAFVLNVSDTVVNFAVLRTSKIHNGKRQVVFVSFAALGFGAFLKLPKRRAIL